MKKTDFFVGIGSIILGIVVFLKIATFPDSSAMYPRALAICIIVCGAWILGSALIKLKQKENDAENPWKGIDWRRLVAVAALSLIYIMSLSWAGYLIASIVFLVLLLLVLKVRKPLMIAAVSIGLTLAVYVGFKLILQVPLPLGFLKGVL